MTQCLTSLFFPVSESRGIIAFRRLILKKLGDKTLSHTIDPQEDSIFAGRCHVKFSPP